MNLQLATARLGVLLTAEALEAGRHLLRYTSSEEARSQTKPPFPHFLSKVCTLFSKPPGLLVAREEPGLDGPSSCVILSKSITLHPAPASVSPLVQWVNNNIECQSLLHIKRNVKIGCFKFQSCRTSMFASSSLGYCSKLPIPIKFRAKRRGQPSLSPPFLSRSIMLHRST